VTPRLEPHLQLLERAYCYLRLSGVNPAAALKATRSSMATMVEGDVADARDRIWSEIEQRSRGPEPSPVPPPPPLLRGSMHYARESR
jgi:hypothetical protein